MFRKRLDFYCILFLWLCLVVIGSPIPGRTANRVRVVTEQGQSFEGILQSIHNNTIQLRNRGFNLKLSTEAISSISFRSSDTKTPPGTPTGPSLVTRSGRIIPIRRIIQYSGNTLAVSTPTGSRRSFPTGRIRIIRLSGPTKPLEVAYRASDSTTKTLRYQLGTRPFYTDGHETWVITQNGNTYQCQNRGATGKSLPLSLWSLPPDPGTHWFIKQGDQPVGKGSWNRRTSPTSSANRRYQFTLKLQFQKKSKPLTVTGLFDATRLIPLRFTIHARRKRSWTLNHAPLKMSLQPCVLMFFLPRKRRPISHPTAN